MFRQILLITWLVATAVSHSQNPNATPTDVERETVMLNDGYSIQLVGAAAKARGEQVDSYKLFLRHPGGAQDLVWSPPTTEPNDNFNASPNSTNDVTLFRPESGIVKDGVLGVVVGKKTWTSEAWWLRWDLQEKRMLTMVRFTRYGGLGYEFSDSRTMDMGGYKVEIDAQGRVLQNGKRFPRTHYVYEGERKTAYSPIDTGGGIEVTENAKVWPFVARPVARKSDSPEPAHRPDGGPPTSHPGENPAPSGTPAISAPDALPSAQRNAPFWPWVLGVILLSVVTLFVCKRRR